jgi:hypothetical protein
VQFHTEVSYHARRSPPSILMRGCVRPGPVRRRNSRWRPSSGRSTRTSRCRRARTASPATRRTRAGRSRECGPAEGRTG